ncbi:hypothetical protein HZA41_03380, partial [Candidatus Peregrinibacteria bacterium]|nr:hypothetical protein [Candidatus Peregrinibacteria bacterium]
ALLSSAESKAIEVLNSGLSRSRASQFIDQIQSVRDQLDNVIRVKDPRVYADLSASGVAFSPKGLILAKDTVYVYTDNQLLRVVLNQVSAPVRIDETEMVVSGSYFEDRDALVFLMKSGRVVEYQDNRFSFMDTDDVKWKGGVDIAAYSNKLYILSPAENQIWRYVRRRDKYGSAEAYAVGGDFKEVVDLAIDGSVYALKKSGGILKFYTGKAEDFVINKAPITALSSPTKIFTDLDLSQIYILEPSEKRVLVLNKDQKTGNVIYNAQYVFDFEIQDIAVEKMSGKLYLLAGSKIYEAGM